MSEMYWTLGADVRFEPIDGGIRIHRADGTRLKAPRALATLDSAAGPWSRSDLERYGIDRSMLDVLTTLDVLVPAGLDNVLQILDTATARSSAHSASAPATDLLLGVCAVDGNHGSPCATAPDAIRTACPAFQIGSGLLLDPILHRKLNPSFSLRDLGNLNRRTWLPTLVGGLCPEHRLLVLGGDHTLTWYALAGLAQAVGEFQLVHFDAHSDCSTPIAEEHDRLNHASVIRYTLDQLPVKRLIQVGVRAFEWHDPALRWVAQPKIHRIPPDVSVEQARRQLEVMLDPSLPLAVSVDLDVLDPSVAPEVSHPVPGGMSTARLTRILSMLEATYAPVYLDFVEVCSATASSSTTRVAGHVLTSVLLDRHATAAPAGFPWPRHR